MKTAMQLQHTTYEQTPVVLLGAFCDAERTYDASDLVWPKRCFES